MDIGLIIQRAGSTFCKTAGIDSRYHSSIETKRGYTEMKSVIAMSLIGLMGLIATDSHAESFDKPSILVCKVQACVKQGGAQERCEVDRKERAIISDYGDRILITYASEATIESPLLTTRKGRFDLGEVVTKTGKRVRFARRTDGYNFGFTVMGSGTQFEFKNCSVVN